MKRTALDEREACGSISPAMTVQATGLEDRLQILHEIAVTCQSLKRALGSGFPGTCSKQQQNTRT
jgi:hypothetical protein